MFTNLKSLALLGTILSLSFSTVSGEVNIAPDTPINQLVSSAKAARARGATNDALIYFDAAIARDSSDYMTLFQRGATYLAAGKNTQAKADFDSVLRIKPGFEGALLQRAKISARNAEWDSARQDYKVAGSKGAVELVQLDEAEGASYLASEAEKEKDWAGCVNNAGVAIMTATTALSLRQLRAHCRFELGEVQMGVSDLQHVLQINPSSVDPHLQISAMQFYLLGDTEAGLTQVKRCLQSDPESKTCKVLFREMKSLSKALAKVTALIDSRKFTAAVKELTDQPATSDGEAEPGILSQIKFSIASHQASGYILSSAASELYITYLSHTCSAYQSMNALKRSTPFCKELCALSEHALPALMFSAQNHIDAENWEAAINTLKTALEHHPAAKDQIHPKLQDAQVQLKRSKQKDYYKVLELKKDASDREIKSAYRRMTKIHHPDKAHTHGITKEGAEKKMASINEAYEVLSDPELKQRYDSGEDPNDPMTQQGGNPFQGSPFGGGGQQFFFQQGGGGGGGGRQFKFSSGGGGSPFGGFPGFG